MEGFTLFDIPVPRQKFVHVTRSFDELNRVFQVDLALLADNDAFARRLAGHAPVDHAARGDWTADLRKTFEIETTPGLARREIDLPQLMKWLRQRLPEDAIVTNGVGAYATWSQRYFAHYRLHTQLGPISGSMGYSLPAAISAKLLHPKRVVVDFVGDGCYQMSSEELATAVQYGAAVIVVLFNNNMYGTIRIHEENRLEGRVNGTQLVNPDCTRWRWPMARPCRARHPNRGVRTGLRALPGVRQAGPDRDVRVIRKPIHSRYSLTDLRNRRKAKR